MNDILMSPIRLYELESLIQNSVERAIKAHLSQSSDQPDNQFYTPKEAAKKLSLSIATIYAKMSSGELGFSKKGGRAYILQSDIDSYLQDGRKPSNAEISQRNYLK